MENGGQPPTGGAAANPEAAGAGGGAQGLDGSWAAPGDPASSPRSGVQLATIILSAAAIGGLAVWIYLRAGSNPQTRVSHRIDELRHRLDALSKEFARHSTREGERSPGADE